MIPVVYEVRPAQINLGSMMMMVIQVAIFGAFAWMVMKMFIQPEAKPLLEPVRPEEREAELREKKAELEKAGRDIAAEVGGGVKFLRLGEDWQLRFWKPRYWFVDAEGNRLVAEDVDELRWKLGFAERYAR